jgi:uncharacterized protein YecE (DUF72 family)
MQGRPLGAAFLFRLRMKHPIRVGVGGWSYQPWNETFYPAGLPARRQLEYMSRMMTALEVNATFYSSFKPETFAKWADTAPDGFVFSLKAHRFATSRKTRADMQQSIAHFTGQGITQLGDKLGPINWQFPASRSFDREYFDTFLSLLPRERDRVQLRHALEVRGTGFEAPAFGDLLRKYNVAVVWADSDEYPAVEHAGCDFSVSRLMRAQADEQQGYPARAITAYAQRFGEQAKKQDVFAFFISSAKERNPAAAMALQRALGVTPASAANAGEAEKAKAPVRKTVMKKASAKKKAAKKK